MPDLDDRFRSLDGVKPPDLWKRIEGWEECEPLDSRPRRLGLPTPWRKIMAVAATLTVAAAAIAFTVVAFKGSNPKPNPVTPLGVQNGPLVFSTDHGALYAVNQEGTGLRLIRARGVTEPAVSPDGSRIAFVGPGPDVRDIYVMDVDGSKVVRLTHRSRVVPRGVGAQVSDQPTWSPDGREIAFVSGFEGRESIANGCPKVFVMNADGSNQHAITNCGTYLHLGWSPDGGQIAFAGQLEVGATPQPGIWVMNADGTGMVHVPGTLESDIHGAPVWSPDGKRFAFWRGPRLMTTHVEGGRPLGGTTLFRCAGAGCQPYQPSVAWSPDGRQVGFVSQGKLYTVAAGGGRIRGVPLPQGIRPVSVAWGPQSAKTPPSTSTPPPTGLVSTSAILQGGKVRCTAAVPAVVRPGEFTHIRVTLQNLTERTLRPEGRLLAALTVYGPGGRLLWNPWDGPLHFGHGGGFPAPAPRLEPRQTRELEVLDPPVVWSGQIELRVACLEVPLPGLHVSVAVPGPTPSAKDAVSRVLTRTGGTLTKCRPSGDGRWIVGQIPAAGRGQTEVPARCRAIVSPHPGFDVVQIEVVAPARGLSAQWPTAPLSWPSLRGVHHAIELGRWIFLVTEQAVHSVEGPDDIVWACGNFGGDGGGIGGSGGAIVPFPYC